MAICLGAALAAIGATLARTVTGSAWAAVLALVTLVPLALGGHAAGSLDHGNSVDSLLLHLIGVCLWVGGLAALVVFGRRLGDRLPVGRPPATRPWPAGASCWSRSPVWSTPTSGSAVWATSRRRTGCW